jgi:orotidine-5'-phosphate decarboxylase
MQDEARRRLIFALDVDAFEEAKKWVKLLHGQVGAFKVGKQLFTRCGPDVVRMVRAEGGEVFLDSRLPPTPSSA